MRVETGIYTRKFGVIQPFRSAAADMLFALSALLLYVVRGACGTELELIDKTRWRDVTLPQWLSDDDGVSALCVARRHLATNSSGGDDGSGLRQPHLGILSRSAFVADRHFLPALQAWLAAWRFSSLPRQSVVLLFDGVPSRAAVASAIAVAERFDHVAVVAWSELPHGASVAAAAATSGEPGGADRDRRGRRHFGQLEGSAYELLLWLARFVCGATHVQFADDDEVPLATCDAFMPGIGSLRPGEWLKLASRDVWNGTDNERLHPTRTHLSYVSVGHLSVIALPEMPTNDTAAATHSRPAVHCHYEDAERRVRLHCIRRPLEGMSARSKRYIAPDQCGVLHFQACNLENRLMKRIWYELTQFLSNGPGGRQRPPGGARTAHNPHNPHYDFERYGLLTRPLQEKHVNGRIRDAIAAHAQFRPSTACRAIELLREAVHRLLPGNASDAASVASGGRGTTTESVQRVVSRNERQLPLASLLDWSAILPVAAPCCDQLQAAVDHGAEQCASAERMLHWPRQRADGATLHYYRTAPAVPRLAMVRIQKTASTYVGALLAGVATAPLRTWHHCRCQDYDDDGGGDEQARAAQLRRVHGQSCSSMNCLRDRDADGHDGAWFVGDVPHASLANIEAAYGRANVPIADVLLLTTLREPVARFVSEYRYVALTGTVDSGGQRAARGCAHRDTVLAWDYVWQCSNGTCGGGGSNASALRRRRCASTLIDFAARAPIGNRQTRMLSGLDRTQWARHMASAGGRLAALRRATHALEHRFAWFGLAEHMPASVELLARTLARVVGTRTGDALRALAASTRHRDRAAAAAAAAEPITIAQQLPNEPDVETAVAEVRQREQLDLALYEHALRLFSVRTTSLPQQLFLTPPPAFVYVFTTPSRMFDWRMHKAIESALRTHPGAHVRVYTNTLDARRSFARLRGDGHRVDVVPYDAEALLCQFVALHPDQAAPVATFAARLPEYATGRYWYAHLADLLRLLVVYFDGGVYSDTGARARARTRAVATQRTAHARRARCDLHGEPVELCRQCARGRRIERWPRGRDQQQRADVPRTPVAVAARVHRPLCARLQRRGVGQERARVADPRVSGAGLFVWQRRHGARCRRRRRCGQRCGGDRAAARRARPVPL